MPTCASLFIVRRSRLTYNRVQYIVLPPSIRCPHGFTNPAFILKLNFELSEPYNGEMIKPSTFCISCLHIAWSSIILTQLRVKNVSQRSHIVEELYVSCDLIVG